MEISAETPERYGEKQGWYEGRLQYREGKPVLSQGQRTAVLKIKPGKLEKFEGEIIFVKAILSLNPREKTYTLDKISEVGRFEGRYRKRYIGVTQDRIIHSERYSCEETEGKDILEDVEIRKEVKFPLWK